MPKSGASQESTPFRNAFIGQAKEPADADLASALGAAKALWDQLVAELTEEHGLAREWNSYSIKAGWALRLKRPSRNIVYLSPAPGSFMASFALGDKAIQAAHASSLPQHVLDLIAKAKRYAEGTVVRIVVSGSCDIAIVKKLTKIKLEN